MAGTRRNEFTENMKQDMYEYYWESYDDAPGVYEQIFDVVQSTAAYEIFNTAIGLGKLLEKPEGEDLKADSPIESYTIYCANKTFGRMVRFSKESVEDSQKTSNFIGQVVGSWGRESVSTKEEYYAQFFNYGALTAGHKVFNNTMTGLITDPSGDVIYDSQPFFDTAHADKVGNTYSNHESGYALTEANLQTVWNTYTVTNAKDERAELIDLTPDVLLIPNLLTFTAKEILNTSLIPNSMDNTINVLESIVEPLPWRYLTDTDGWFLGQKKKGLIATSRETANLDFWQDENNKDYFASIIERFGGAVTNWRYWFGCAISAT